jgi:UvrD-like helicase C-terminal domain
MSFRIWIQPDMRIIAIGDLAQNIYRFRNTSNEFLRRLLKSEVCPDLKSLTLTTNFRSTHAILRAVNALFANEIRDGHVLPMRPAPGAAEGAKPCYYEFAVNPTKGMGEYEELVAQTVFPILERAKRESKSVALVFPITKCPSFELVHSALIKYSREKGYTIDLHKIAKEDETCQTVSFRYDPKDVTSPVQFSTIHSSKGLEWDIVMLIDMSDYIYDLRGAEDCEGFYAEKTNLTYVGITRAKEELYIFANANGGGRHRQLARLGDSIHTVFDVTTWGTEWRDYDAPKRKPIGVTQLIRRFPQHPDLFERVKACSQHIHSIGIDGFRMFQQEFYDDMKQRWPHISGRHSRAHALLLKW